MEKDILQFERIRSYIQDRMSVEERTSFERDLLSDKNLSAEYEFLKGVSQAVVKINSEEELRALLAKAEEEHKANPAIVDEEKLQRELEKVERDLAMLDKAEEKPSFINRVKAWFIPGPNDGSSTEPVPVIRLPYSSRLAISLAVAAGLALAIILPYNANLAKSGYTEATSLLEAGNWQINSLRGDDEMTDLIKDCYEMIQAGKYDDALKSIDNAEATLEEMISSLSGDDSAISRLAELNRIKQEIEWDKVLLLMKEKKVGKAKKLLKVISSSDGVHSREAQRILSEVY